MSRRQAEKHRIDAMMKQRGNNMHDRAAERRNSPDDPDNKPPPNIRGEPGETRQAADPNIDNNAAEIDTENAGVRGGH